MLLRGVVTVQEMEVDTLQIMTIKYESSSKQCIYAYT